MSILRFLLLPILAILCACSSKSEQEVRDIWALGTNPRGNKISCLTYEVLGCGFFVPAPKNVDGEICVPAQVWPENLTVKFEILRADGRMVDTKTLNAEFFREKGEFEDTAWQYDPKFGTFILVKPEDASIAVPAKTQAILSRNLGENYYFLQYVPPHFPWWHFQRIFSYYGDPQRNFEFDADETYLFRVQVETGTENSAGTPAIPIYFMTTERYARRRTEGLRWGCIY